MFSRCFPLSSLLQEAWFQRNHRTNQRPIPAHRWPVSHFSLRLKGKSTPGASAVDQGASVAPAAPGPLCFHCVGAGPWHTPNIEPTASASAPRSAVWCTQSLEKPWKLRLHPLLAQGRVWVKCVFWVWHPLKRYDNNGPLSRSYYVFGWEQDLVLLWWKLDASQRCFEVLWVC